MTKILPAAYKGSEPYIFVSYSHRDSDEVMKDIAWMIEKGYRVWYDEGIEFGQDFPRELATAIKNCSQFVVYLSKNSIESEYVNREINYAIHLKLKVFPIFLEQTELSDKLDFFLSTLQRLDRYRYEWNSFCNYFEKGLIHECIKKDEVVIEPVKTDDVKEDEAPVFNFETEIAEKAVEDALPVTDTDIGKDISQPDIETNRSESTNQEVSFRFGELPITEKVSEKEKWVKTRAFKGLVAAIAFLAILIPAIIIGAGKPASGMANGELSGMSEIATTEPIETEKAETQLPESAEAVPDSESVLNIWCWDEDFRNRFEAYFADAGKIPEGVEIRFTIIPYADNVYQNALDIALNNQKIAADNDKVDIFLVEADYAAKYLDSEYTLDVGNGVGLSQKDIANQFDYTKKIATDSNGVLKAVSYQAAPGMFFYRRSIAKEVLGTDDPTQVQAYLSNWTKFGETASKMKDAGYYMLSGYDDTLRVFSSNVTKKWVDDNGTIQMDDNILNWIERKRQIYRHLQLECLT